MNHEEFCATLRMAGGLFKGHFVLRSGDHSDLFLDFDEVLTKHSDLYLRFAHELAAKLKNQHLKFDVVFGCGTNGAILACMVAAHYTMTYGKPVGSVYADDLQSLMRVTGSDISPRPPRFVLRSECARGLGGKRAVFVDDVLSNGTTLREADELADRCGATIVACGFFADRSPVRRLEALGDRVVVSIARFRHVVQSKEKECHQCWEKKPVNTEHGHGAEFVARMKKKPKH